MKKFIVLSLVVLTVSACSSKMTKPEDHAAFWNRTNASSALYMRGPKAQHMLHKDIASCVSEVKELSRLGTIRNANPPIMHEFQRMGTHKLRPPRSNQPRTHQL